MRKALDYSCPNPSSSHLHRRYHQVQGLATETPKRPRGRSFHRPHRPFFTGTPAPPRTAERFVMWSRLGFFNSFSFPQPFFGKCHEIVIVVRFFFSHQFFQFSCNLSMPLAVPRPMVDAHIAASRHGDAEFISLSPCIFHHFQGNFGFCGQRTLPLASS